MCIYVDLEVGWTVDLVSSSEPLDGRRRLANHAALEPHQFSLGAFDVLEQLGELGWNVSSGCHRSVAYVAQRCRPQRANRY